MKIYLAARYSRRRELCDYAADLRMLGHEITSRWLLGNHQLTDAELAADGGAPEMRAQFAQEDWDDLMASDTVISFTEPPRKTNSRGGRHVEFGAALAAGKRNIVVGERENVFHCLPDVVWFPGWVECIAAIMRGGYAIEIICGGCGEAIPIALAHVLPGNPPEARCARCLGEEAPRG